MTAIDLEHGTTLRWSDSVLERELFGMLETPGELRAMSGLEDLAFHEAGHAVMSCLLDEPIDRVEIGLHVGRMVPAGTVRWVLPVLWAGLAAESLHAGWRDWVGASSDTTRVLEMSLGRAGDGAGLGVVCRPPALDRARAARPRTWAAVERVAAALIEDRRPRRVSGRPRSNGVPTFCDLGYPARTIPGRNMRSFAVCPDRPSWAMLRRET